MAKYSFTASCTLYPEDVLRLGFSRPLPAKNLGPSVHPCCVAMEDDSLNRFWEIEDYNLKRPVLSQKENTVVEHFDESHYKDESGRFVIPLPRKPGVVALGESRSHALETFSRLNRSLWKSATVHEFADVIRKYFDLNHAEPVLVEELDNPRTEVYYYPMHAVRKETSSTSKICVVLGASATTTSGMSLNDQLLVGPTIHCPLVDVLLQFRQHKVVLTADVSRIVSCCIVAKGAKGSPPFPVEGGPASASEGLPDD